MKTFLRILLGLFLIVMGANKFLGFMAPPQLPPAAAEFMAALANTNYMLSMVGAMEILCGTLLLSAATAPLAILLLAPISINIFAFHLFLAPGSISGGAFVLLANIALGVLYFSYFRSIFANLFTEKVMITRKDRPNPVPVTIVNR